MIEINPKAKLFSSTEEQVWWKTDTMQSLYVAYRNIFLKTQTLQPAKSSKFLKMEYDI